MKKLSDTGRIFYAIAMAGLGLQTIYYGDFPYMLLPPSHSWIPGPVTYIFGALLILTSACIVFKKKTGPVSLLLGAVLLLIFCFYFVPYEFMTDSNYTHLGSWENAEKELALSAGALVIAGCFSETNKKTLTGFLGRLIPFGIFLFSITIISFGIDHFLYAKDAADYIPSWIPNHISWIYIAGVALIGSGLAILLKIRTGLFATLLGIMIFIWFIILHIPKAINSPDADRAGEITSAFLALAYCGIAFVIAGCAKR